MDSTLRILVRWLDGTVRKRNLWSLLVWKMMLMVMVMLQFQISNQGHSVLYNDLAQDHGDMTMSRPTLENTTSQNTHLPPPPPNCCLATG